MRRLLRRRRRTTAAAAQDLPPDDLGRWSRNAGNYENCDSTQHNASSVDDIQRNCQTSIPVPDGAPADQRCAWRAKFPPDDPESPAPPDDQHVAAIPGQAQARVLSAFAN